MLARVNWMKIRIIRQYVLYGLIHVLEWTAVSRAADMYRCHACEHLHVTMWLDGKFVYPVQVPGEIPVRVPGY